ncbi:hypothetical protein EROM_101390 [Encephalitozoon romaleae SJ-2008]|uniref:Uncharacterized protein n=1 Tax=Encephalitozoon romaleae (strain SJ-2008) TaxID=1178016 RepID=I7APZ9_ENCRO|nr:hypothetical protein EROM_101390 [Encephalitozoon romaleae SJ-2008]AFN83954.1 hypothetical protein EROM_101390 [Encephalitozoon romaleae SJ-2008]
MDESSDKGKGKESISNEKVEEDRMLMVNEESNAENRECLGSNVMKHVIGAACMLSHKSSSEDIVERSEEKVSTFDVYIVNENGKVNGYELKHISPIDGPETEDPPRDIQVDEMMKSFHFDRKSKGVPPHEFYRRRRSSELPRNNDGNNSSGAKEKCDPIILEISEISDTYNTDGMNENQDDSTSNQSTTLNKDCSQQGEEVLTPSIVLSDSTGQESFPRFNREDLTASECSRERNCVVLLNESNTAFKTSGIVSSETKNGSPTNSETEVVTLPDISKAIKLESEEKKDMEANSCEDMGDIIKAIQAQEPSDKLSINQKIGLNSPYDSAGKKCQCETMRGSESLSKELKTALLAAFVPSMEPSKAETAEASETSEMSFVETSITRNINENMDTTGEIERFRAVLNLGSAANNPTYSDGEKKPKEEDKDNEMIVFVEAEDIYKKKSSTLTRNNKVGRLVKFFESLEERNKEKD